MIRNATSYDVDAHISFHCWVGHKCGGDSNTLIHAIPIFLNLVIVWFVN